MMGCLRLTRASTLGKSHTGRWFHRLGHSQFEICLTVNSTEPNDPQIMLKAKSRSEMHEILTQLVLKWARYGPDHSVFPSSPRHR